MHCSRTHSLLGFIKRICNNFRDIRALDIRNVFTAPMCLVWQPHCNNRKVVVESIQKKFVWDELWNVTRRISVYPLTNHGAKHSKSGPSREDESTKLRSSSAIFCRNMSTHKSSPCQLWLPRTNEWTVHNFKLFLLSRFYTTLQFREIFFAIEFDQALLPDVMPYERYLD